MDNLTQQSCNKEGLQPLLQINAAQNTGAKSITPANPLLEIPCMEIPTPHKHGDSKIEGLEKILMLYCEMCDKFVRTRAFHANHKAGHLPFKRKKHNSRAIKQKRGKKGKFADPFAQRRPQWIWRKTKWLCGGVQGFNKRSTNTYNLCNFLPIKDVYKVVSETKLASTLSDEPVWCNEPLRSVSSKNLKQFLLQCGLDINQVYKLATDLELDIQPSAKSEVFLSASTEGCKLHCTPLTSHTHTYDSDTHIHIQSVCGADIMGHCTLIPSAVCLLGFAG